MLNRCDGDLLPIHGRTEFAMTGLEILGTIPDDPSVADV